ncbi:MAG: RIP metalloprotease RseP [Patescibacteria group bacterium]
MFTLIIFIAVLAVLVLSHEFGHFIVARSCGIKVEEFGFGFPPRLIGIRRLRFGGKSRWEIIWSKRQLEQTLEHEHTSTIYSINLIPLGGFVKIKGENSEDETAHDVDSFSSKKIWQKAAVLIAGVALNFVLAAALLSVGYMIGIPSFGDEAGPNSNLLIADILPDKPAALAGLLVGDKIIKIDAIEHASVSQFQSYLNSHRAEQIMFTIEREGKIILKNIQPAPLENDKYGIGVAILPEGKIQYPWYRAIYEGTVNAGKYLVMIFVGLWSLLRGLFSGANMDGAVAGPVGVAVLTGEAARLGFVYLLQLTALLSLNLAAVNILPIPALDGGRLFFVLWGGIFRKSIAPRIEQIIHTVGFVLLLFLIVLVTVKDIGSYGGAFTLWWNNFFRF